MDWDDDPKHPARHFASIHKDVRREPIRLERPQWRIRLSILLALMPVAAIVAAAVVIFFARPSYPRELYPGQYAQVDPAIRQWFRDQKVPGTTSSCCSESDGVYAEEDIRGGHYWTRFVAMQYNDGAPTTEIQSEWMQVPDEAVIHDPNRHGAPVVWWGWNGALIIRCYAPGGGV